MSRSWDEVRELLEDPFVDGDTKEHLLAAYLKETGGGRFVDMDRLPEEVQEWAREHGDRYSLEGGDFDQGSLEEVYDRAQGQSEDHGGYRSRQVEDELGDSETELDGMQPPAVTGPGVETSDEIFNLAQPALKVFETWLPINDDIPENLLGQHRRISIDDVQTRFDEQRGINFRKFMEDADRIRTAHTALTEMNSTAERELSSVYQSWTGPAANASYDHYSQQVAPNATALLDALSAAPGLIETAVQNVFQECKDKANDVIELYQPTMGGAPPYIAKKLIKLAKGEEISQDQAMPAVSWIARASGTDLEEGMDSDLWRLVLPELQRWAREWIREQFNPDLHDDIYSTFEQTCTSALEAVNSYYEELNTALGEYQNGFSDAAALLQAPPPGSATGAGGGGGPGAGSGGGMPAGAAGSAVVPDLGDPGSMSMPGGGGSMPAPPPLADPAGTGSGTEDVPGTEPSTVDEAAGTEPVDELSPVLGSQDPAQRDTVTIDDGDRKISVTSPDGQGRVTVTVDDGSGAPKTYELDLGTGPGSSGAAEPSTPEVPAPANAVVAGPDGVAVIADGDLSITAERPSGSPDQVVLTIDDSSGTPTTYTLDYTDPDNPTAAASAQPAPSGQAGSAWIPDQGEYTSATAPSGGYSGGSGEAGLATASDDAGQSSGVSGGAGMPMMGGLGAADAGDGERSASAWRIAGDLFDDDQPVALFRGVIGRS